ncbi:phosphoribosylanthranilate isomerase [Pikeienuella sp. HZG-20]|uniref:phosphoribosylanthranilate isomerase n=1 Tax=Paludibacillus litoralis TaxID=3133267 RepID=UPI0030EBFC99
MIVKICGLRTPGAVAAAASAGARYLGFVLYPKSPRNVTPAEAGALAAEAPAGLMKVALVVDPDDALIDRVAALPIDMIQLHGRESPARVRAVKARAGLPVMKALGVAEAADLDAVDAYAGVADQLLIDAKPPLGGGLPGGNGLTFDWRLLAGRRWTTPWMLAGGLNAGNVAEAARLTGARQVDVSSGVETAPGVKDEALIRAFVAAALA